jgi:hypothetical protein
MWAKDGAKGRAEGLVQEFRSAAYGSYSPRARACGRVEPAGVAVFVCAK